MLELVSSKDKASYKAFESARSGTPFMLDLRLSDDLGWAITYAHMRVTRSSLPADALHTLTLFHAVGTATITGRNLHELKDKLAAYAVNWIQVYDPIIHAAPDDAAPVITAIEFQESANPYEDA